MVIVVVVSLLVKTVYKITRQGGEGRRADRQDRTTAVAQR
jgi:hypothetical protein